MIACFIEYVLYASNRQTFFAFYCLKDVKY